MSEFSTSDIPVNSAVPGQGALTPEAVEAVLADFRSWLQQAAPLTPPSPPGGEGFTKEPSPPGGEGGVRGADGEVPAEPLDLHTLLAQFVALRHEVNLQTRSARAQQDHNAQMLRHLGDALEALQASREAAAGSRSQDQEEAVRPLLKTLLDLYDALALASREVQRVEQALLPSLAEITAAATQGVDLSRGGETPPLPPGGVSPPLPRLPLWARLLGVGGSVRQALAQRQESAQERQQTEQRQRQAQAEQAVSRVRQVLTSLVTGYTMSVQRLERALHQYDLEPIPCVGEPFDPEVMEAVEVVTDPGRSSTEVIEEVRRGYLWRGRVFRYAQVRVARPGGPQA